MFYYSRHIPRGLSTLEGLIAGLILTIAVTGIAMMSVLSMKGNKQVKNASLALHLGKQVLEDLKAEPLTELSQMACQVDHPGLCASPPATMPIFQETQLNGAGHTWQSQFETDKLDATQTCFGQAQIPTPDSQSPCAKALKAKGPYHFTLSYVMYMGQVLTYIGSRTRLICETYASPLTQGPKPEIEPDCRVNPSDPATRPKALACLPQDNEPFQNMSLYDKGIFLAKVLVTWRERDGTCGSVPLQSTFSKDN